MSSRSLPARPDLAQLKLQATELRRAWRTADAAAIARILAHHPRLGGRSPADVLSMPFKLADAQLVLAREYGFKSWASLKGSVELAGRLLAIKPHPDFDTALAALDAGDTDRLAALITAHPELVSARTNLEPEHGYFAGATLLHHVAGNPGREGVRLPDNIVEVARLLLDAGADVNASTMGRNGGTVMGLLLTSHQASRRGFSAPLIDLLLEYGAQLDLDSPGVLDASLTNHAPAAADRLIELGASPDLFAAAALGRMPLLRAAFNADGRLVERPVRKGRRMSERDAIGLAMLHAYVRHQSEAVEFLLQHDGNWNMTGVNNGTALHRAAFAGDLAMVRRLVDRGADTCNRDNPFHATPLSWAQHNNQDATFDWLQANGRVDLHDAVCFDLMHHVEARLREDAAAVHARLNQWNIPDCTALHWASWLHYDSVGGRHAHDPARRAALVELLLDHGADPDAVAGNGMTPLDIAHGARATAIIEILEARGARRAADLRPIEPK